MTWTAMKINPTELARPAKPTEQNNRIDANTASDHITPVYRPVWLRTLYAVAGLVFLGLGLLGVVLPGLPTTPFILLSAACFARSSRKIHSWLLTNRWSGPILRDWVRHKNLTRRVRWIAIGSMTTMVCLSIWIVRSEPWLQAILVLAGVIGAWSVLRIPLRKPAKSSSETSS